MFTKKVLKLTESDLEIYHKLKSKSVEKPISISNSSTLVFTVFKCLH